jgi:glycosyltransferase involved in cell wall biosynthesis
MTLRLLFVKESQSWPRARGHDVHGYHLMKAMAERGHSVSLATMVPPTREALQGLPLHSLYTLSPEVGGRLPITPWQDRFARYYGGSSEYFKALDRLLQERSFDAVVLVARHLLPLLSAVHGPVRVWYPADDPAWHHLTRLDPLRPRSWCEFRTAGINILYERAFATMIDRVWVVSRNDRIAMRLFSGCQEVDLMPNGVDADHYRPACDATIPSSCVFWGRLDFDPNVDALQWFIRKIWPTVIRRNPTVRFDVFGFAPRAEVLELARTPGVEVHADLPDLRGEVVRRRAVVLPFVTGGGIKNKLLEAAAMGMPIACTRWALSGTRGKPAVMVCRRPVEWAEALERLWSDDDARQALGDSARRWVMEHHTWDAAARTGEAGILRTLAQRKPTRLDGTMNTESGLVSS